MELHPPQQGPHPRRQLLGDDRLGDVVVGARLEPGHEVVGVGLGGDDDDRDDALAPHRAAHVEALDVGEAEVEQDEIRLLALERGQAAATVLGLLHLVALVLEGHADGQPDLVVVLDEQHSMHRTQPPPPATS